MTRTALWLIGVFALIAAACVAFGAYFSSVTLGNAYRSAVEARFAVTAERLAAVVERAASLGIALQAQTTLTGLLEAEARIEPALRSIDLVDEHNVVVFSSVPTRVGQTLEAAPAHTVRRTALNDLEVPIGRVVMRYDPATLEAGGETLRADLWRIAWPALAGACLATIAVGLLLAQSLRRAARRAADPAHWPPAARQALAEADAAHAFLAERDQQPNGDGAMAGKGGR